MRMIIAAATIAASVIAAPSIASAGAFQSTGWLESVNVPANTVQIRNGDTYRLPAHVDASEFRTGQKVHVIWDVQSPQNIPVSGDRSVQLVRATGIQSAN